MSKYTLELRYLYKDKKFKLFDFPYNLYDNDLKPWFEEKFIQHFMFYEIGFDSVAMFKQRLMSKLNDIFPYYKQLYETELESRNINFLLNKDLKETFIREIDSENQSSGINTTQQNSNSTNTISQNGESSNNHKESTIRDGVSVSSLSDGYLTGVSSDNSTSSSTGNSNSSDDIKTEGTLSQKGNEKSIEKTELISQGNIGVTSSAHLLKAWREVLINMDEIIIESCNDLFMKIY